MSYKKRAVPIIQPDQGSIFKALSALRENVEIITGRQGSKIEILSDTASTAQIIAKINEIIDVLQG